MVTVYTSCFDSQ